MRFVFLSFFLYLFVLACSDSSHFQSLSSISRVQLASLGAGDIEEESAILGSKKGLLDILILADTSPSMQHHLQHLGQSLEDLFFVISDYDWQLGITSVDHGDHQSSSGLQQSWRDYINEPYGRFGSLIHLENGTRILKEKVLNPQMSNYKNIFFHSLSHSPEKDCRRPPYCHSHLEQPLRSLQSAIKKSSLDNSSLFRPQADFVSIIITNEEERAEDHQRATQAEEVVETFDRVFHSLDKRFLAFNIIITDQACLTEERKNSPAVNQAPSIAKLASLTGGRNISICRRNYGSALQEISERIKHSLENVVVLKKDPIPRTIEVVFEEEELDWRLEGREIVFVRKKAGPHPIPVSIFYRSKE